MSYKDDLESIAHPDSLGLRKVVSEIGERADKEITILRTAIEYSVRYLNENKLNTIGHKSKAHQELIDALMADKNFETIEEDNDANK